MGLKIDGSNRQAGNVSNRINNDMMKTDSKSQSHFDSHLKRHSSQNKDEMLQQMAKDIIQQGQRLTDKVDIAELKAYKRMISEFLEESVRSFAKFSKESFMDRRGRHRLYATVKNVNESLEELTQEVLKNEKDHLKIVGRIEDIRGLILDLLL